MALYKARGIEPSSGRRIDGEVWSPVGPGSTIRRWPYPTNHPSRQFDRFNKTVLNLAEGWAAMDSPAQQRWGGAWPPPGWWLWCVMKPVGSGSYGFEPSAEDWYKAVNTARAFCGEAPTDIPPLWQTSPDGDSLSFVRDFFGPAPAWPLQVNVNVTWNRSGPTGGLPYRLMLWADSRSGATSVPRGTRQLRAAGVLPVQVGVTMSINSQLLDTGLVVPGSMLRMFAQIGEVGMAPFFGGGGLLQNKGLH
jgi:hypothetical protein